jgi:hypothetical protein
MSVTVDRRPLAAEQLGIETVGQLLSHLQRDSNRLIVQVLIDGQEPDLSQLTRVKKIPLRDHILFVETADPRELAVSVLAEVENQLEEADRLRGEASDLIVRGNNHKAMEKLSGCFTTWQHAQESVLKTAQLLRLDLENIDVDGQRLSDLVRAFAEQLRSIKGALENRDFVLLNDILTYEAHQTSAKWRSAIGAIRGAMPTC